MGNRGITGRRRKGSVHISRPTARKDDVDRELLDGLVSLLRMYRFCLQPAHVFQKSWTTRLENDIERLQIRLRKGSDRSEVLTRMIHIILIIQWLAASLCRDPSSWHQTDFYPPWVDFDMAMLDTENLENDGLDYRLKGIADEVARDLKGYVQQIPEWTVHTHYLSDQDTKRAVKTVLLCAQRQRWPLPNEILHIIFAYVAQLNRESVFLRKETK